MNLRDCLSVRHLSAAVPGPAPVLVFGHGYGCDQGMWEDVCARLPEFERVLFNWPGVGDRALAAYDVRRHERLEGYAEDLVRLLAELGLRDVVFVGHSMAASVGALAAVQAPQHIGQLVMIAPSPCFRNDLPAYPGGFEAEQLESLVRGLADSHSAWAQSMAPLIMGNPARPELAERLRRSLCAIDPTVALRWGRAVFFADTRAAMAALPVPALVLHCSADALVPAAVADWMAAHIPCNRLVTLAAQGHCPHVSQPDEVADLLRRHLGALERH